MMLERFSLQVKLIGGGIFFLVPLMMIGFFSVYQSGDALEKQAMLQMTETAKSVSNMVDLAIREELKIVAQTARKNSIVGVLSKRGLGESAEADIERLLGELTTMVEQSGGDYEAVFIADPSGQILANGDGKNSRFNVADREYVKTAMSGKINCGSVSISKSTGIPILPFSAPVYAKTGQIIGVVGLVVKIHFLTDRIAAVKVGKTGYAYIVNKDGLVISHPQKDLILSFDLSKEESMKGFATRMQAGETGSQAYVFKGVKKVTGFAPASSVGWAVSITQDFDEMMAPAHVIRNVIIGIALFFIFVAAVAIFFFARSMTRPIGYIARELGEASQQVASASGQIASASQHLAEGASEQASSLEETSSSLEEMASMTRQNAENAVHARTLMTEAKKIVEKVDDHMSDMVEAVQEVSNSSEETGKIIKTIDEIAFQTNLLALNAAVEAARAGEAGAGFAVVADEVRNLAMRAAEAARTTSVLIERTINTVKRSRELTEQTQSAFRKNVEISGKVGNLVDEIAAASDEQAQGIGQINTAMSEMDRVVQQTAANAEESASASEEMNAQAEKLQGLVAELVRVIRGSGADAGRAPAAYGDGGAVAKLPAK